jgi:hypothetical protein
MIVFRKDKDNRRSVYSVSMPLFAMLPLLGIVVALALVTIRGCAAL